MTIPLILALPADDEALREKVVQRLSPYAEVTVQPPAAFDLSTVKLVIEVTAGALSIVKTLLELREMYRQSGQKSGIRVGAPGERGTPLEDADEALLRRLLNAE